mgnify:CR=1 FL=1
MVLISLSFEPTYKELKSQLAIVLIDVIQVLSLPIRNWNVIKLLIIVGGKKCFEPTYKELK